MLPAESLGDRLYALRDMIAPGTRRAIVSNVQAAGSWTWSGLRYGGQASFVLATAFLFYGIPYMLATVEDAQIAEQEQELKMREQGTEVRLNPSPQHASGGGHFRPASGSLRDMRNMDD